MTVPSNARVALGIKDASRRFRDDVVAGLTLISVRFQIKRDPMLINNG